MIGFIKGQSRCVYSCLLMATQRDFLGRFTSKELQASSVSISYRRAQRDLARTDMVLLCCVSVVACSTCVLLHSPCQAPNKRCVVSADLESKAETILTTLYTSQDPDEAVNYLYGRFHNLLTDGDYDTLNEVFQKANLHQCGIRFAKFMLDLTNKYKQKISGYQAFYKRVYDYTCSVQGEQYTISLLRHLG